MEDIKVLIIKNQISGEYSISFKYKGRELAYSYREYKTLKTAKQVLHKIIYGNPCDSISYGDGKLYWAVRFHSAYDSTLVRGKQGYGTVKGCQKAADFFCNFIDQCRIKASIFIED